MRDSTTRLIERLARVVDEHRRALSRVRLSREQRTEVNRSFRALYLAVRTARGRLEQAKRSGGTALQRKLAVENKLLRRMLKMRSLEGPAFRRRLAEVEAVRRSKGCPGAGRQETKDARIERALAEVRASAAEESASH